MATKNKQLKITLVRSPIHREQSYKSCVKGLGLRRLHHTVIVEDTLCNRGMINKVIDMLKINTSTYYFTSSLPASEAAGLIAAIKIAEKEELLRVQLWKNVYQMNKGLFDLGVDFPLRFSQIIPIILYDEKKAYEIEAYLYKHGILCSAVTVPAVAPGKARLRASLNATHTDKHIDRFLNGINDAIKKFNIPTVKRTKNEWDTF